MSQVNEYHAAVIRHLPDLPTDRMQELIGDPAGLKKFLAGLAKAPSAKLKKQKKVDTIIRVDRLIRPTYPAWATEVKHPELETIGPAEYDLAKEIEPWLHDGQKNAPLTTGNVIYESLKATDTLKICLGLHDACAIQAKGIDVFRKIFGGKVTYFWKSVVRDRVGSLHVPYLYEYGGEVFLGWSWRADGWYGSEPALRFRK